MPIDPYQVIHQEKWASPVLKREKGFLLAFSTDHSFLPPSPSPFSSRIKSMKHAIGALLAQLHVSCVPWVLASLGRRRAQNIPSPPQPLGGGGAIILKIICIVLIHPPLPKWFIFNPHHHCSKNSTARVWEGDSLPLPTLDNCGSVDMIPRTQNEPNYWDNRRWDSMMTRHLEERDTIDSAIQMFYLHI